MEITNVKMNGIKNPIGYTYNYLVCSWNVINTKSKKQKYAKIIVSDKADLSNIIYIKEGESLKQKGEKLEVDLKPRTTYYYQIQVRGDQEDTGISDVYFFETGKMEEEWKADWITTRKEETFLPVFKKKFTAKNNVRRARLYITGVGLFEAYLNGKKIGDEFLTPYLTDYETRIQSITFPIEDMIEGDNTLEIITSHGWYMGWFGLGDEEKTYGDRMAVISELHIEYEDNSLECILTDDSWKYYGSDIEEAGIYIGEIYNRLLWDGKENPEKDVLVLNPKEEEGTKNLIKSNIFDRLSLPLVVKEQINVKEVIHSPAGETILDMGQNFAGFVSFYADLPRGRKVTLEFGEILQEGNFYNDNYRDARPEFTYVSGGQPEKVRVHFTFYGLRYVKLTGWPKEIDPSLFTGEVLYSDIDRTGYIKTSQEKINKLYENTVWGLKSNFLDIPTDCPQRSERLGWTGDTQVFAPTASYHMDTRAFYHKFIGDLKDEQNKLEGAVFHYFPNVGKENDFSSVWGDVATLLPNTLYNFYGNLDEIKYSYKMMKDWVDYIHRIDKEKGGKNLFDFGFHFGDWLALDGASLSSFKGSTDDHFIASVYYYRSTQILSEMAGRLGKTEEESKYNKLAKNIYQSILKEYFTPNGRLSVDTQTAYIISLAFGIYIEKDRVIKQYKNRLKKDCNQLKTGFVGTPLLCTSLAENGMVDIAYEFLLNEEFPGWLHCVNLGATTVWERWNSVLPDGTINPAGMNSLNHYAYGSVMEFVYAYVSGIRPLEPGFTKVKIAPNPDIRLGWVQCKYESVSGIYVCNWQIKSDGSLHVHVEVPFNCTAVIEFPHSSNEKKELEAGVYDFTYMPEKDYKKPYTLTTPISRIAKDKRAMDILLSNVPPFAGMASGDDKEFKAKCLGDLKYMGYVPHDPGKLKKAIEEICELEYDSLIV